jgi:Transmembrane secretion effector
VAEPMGAGLAYATGTAITIWLSRRDPAPAPSEGRPAPLTLLAEGLSYLAKHRVLRTLAGAVAIGGGLLTVRLTRWLGERTAVLISLAAFVVSMVVLGAVRQVVVSVSAMLLMGFFSMVWNITVNSYRQRVVPLTLLGRVTSVFRMVAFITMPLSALLAGLGTHAIGLPWTYIFG